MTEIASTAPVAVKVATPPPIAPAGGEMKIVRAEKKAGKLRIAITGPSGSGKSYSSLLIAAGIVGKESVRKDGTPKILVVDTENASMADYGQGTDGSWPVVPFDMLSMTPEYTVPKYLTAMKMAHEAGYEVVVFDSLTHVWAGQGGLLEQKNRMDSRGGNSFANWGKVDPMYNAFRDMILQNPIHLVATMRSKSDYVLDDKGKPTKVGLAPIMRDGMEYEFTVVFDLDLSHQAQVSKHRTGLLYKDRGLFVPTIETGRELINWRMSGGKETAPVASTAPAIAASAPVVNTAATSGRATPARIIEIGNLARERGTTLQQMRTALKLPLTTLNAEQAEVIIVELMKMPVTPEKISWA